MDYLLLSIYGKKPLGIWSRILKKLRNIINCFVALSKYRMTILKKQFSNKNRVLYLHLIGYEKIHEIL